MVNVVVIDDHELIRIATASLLSEKEGINVIGDASSGNEGIDLAIKLKPDIVITDIDMPGMNGIEVTRRLTSRLKGIKVIALSRHSKSPYPERILEAGACGYINKGSSPEYIFEAIGKAMDGDKFISPEVASNLIFNYASGDSKTNPFDKLTKREMQIVLMLIQGNRPSAIADILQVSVKTVFTHRSRIHAKLGVSNDVELTNLASDFKLM